MALKFISKDSVPNYMALSSDIGVDNKIVGASNIGSVIYLTDTKDWKIIESDLTLGSYNLSLPYGGATAENQTDVIHENVHTGSKEVRMFSEGHICAENSSIIPLEENETFIGDWQNTVDYSEIIVSVNSDKDSAIDGLVVQWSSQGTLVDETDEFSISANKGKTFSFPCNRKYVRIQFTNGAVAQTVFDIQTLLKRFASKGSSHRVDSNLVAQDDAILTKSILSATRAGDMETYQNINSDVMGNLYTVIGGITQDTGGRVRVSQLTTLGDYKILNADSPLLMENAGTGTGTFVANKYNMAVTSGQWYVRQSRRYHPYFSGASQMVECTFDSFGLQANVVKRVGYFSSGAVSPFTATLDGFWLENTGTSYVLKASRAGTESVSVDWTDWDNYDLISNYNFDNFTFILFDFLWLGGAVLRLWIKTNRGFIMVHAVHYSGSAQDVFIQSPNQPIRYEIRSSTGSGSFRYICSQVSTEGSINRSGLSRSVNTGTSNIQMNTIGTTYPLKAIRKLATFRDVAAFVEKVQVFVLTANDIVGWSVQINPTLSAGLTYGSIANSGIEEASGNGTITVTSPGTIIDSGYVFENSVIPNGSLLQNFLSYMGGTLANVMDQYVLCVTPVTANAQTFGAITFKEI